MEHIDQLNQPSWRQQLQALPERPAVHRQSKLSAGANYKSIGLAFLLAFLFGPLGLVYASAAGGICLIILGCTLCVLTQLPGFVLTWLASIVWAVVAAGNFNRKIDRLAYQRTVGFSLQQAPAGEPETQSHIAPKAERGISGNLRAGNQSKVQAFQTVLEEPPKSELETDEESGWYYVYEGKPCGPLNSGQLAEQFRALSLTARTLVWHSGMTNWAEAEATAIFSAVLNSPALAVTPPEPDVSYYSVKARARVLRKTGLIGGGILLAIMPLIYLYLRSNPYAEGQKAGQLLCGCEESRRQRLLERKQNYLNSFYQSRYPDKEAARNALPDETAPDSEYAVCLRELDNYLIKTKFQYGGAPDKLSKFEAGQNQQTEQCNANTTVLLNQVQQSIEARIATLPDTPRNVPLEAVPDSVATPESPAMPPAPESPPDEDLVAETRKKYVAIKALKPDQKKVAFDLGDCGGGEVLYNFADNRIVSVFVKNHTDQAERYNVDEFYFWEGALLFVFRKYIGADPQGPAPGVEYRYYIRDNRTVQFKEGNKFVPVTDPLFPYRMAEQLKAAFKSRDFRACICALRAMR